MVALLVFIMATFEKNCWTQKVHSVVTFSKIWLDIHIHESFELSTHTFLPFSFHNNLKEDTAFRCIGVKHLN